MHMSTFKRKDSLNGRAADGGMLPSTHQYNADLAGDDSSSAPSSSTLAQGPPAGNARSFRSGTGSTRSTVSKIQQLAKGGMEVEIRGIRTVLAVLALAVIGLGIGIVLYIANVASSIQNNSASVWVAGQRRRAMQTGIDTVLWMSF